MNAVLAFSQGPINTHLIADVCCGGGEVGGGGGGTIIFSVYNKTQRFINTGRPLPPRSCTGVVDADAAIHPSLVRLFLSFDGLSSCPILAPPLESEAVCFLLDFSFLSSIVRTSQAVLVWWRVSFCVTIGCAFESSWILALLAFGVVRSMPFLLAIATLEILNGNFGEGKRARGRVQKF